MLLLTLFAQAQHHPGKLIIRAVDATAIPIPNNAATGFAYNFPDQSLETLFANYNVTNFTQAYPAAANFDHPLAAGLLREYELTCNCDETVLMNDLIQNYSNQYERVYYVDSTQELGNIPSEKPKGTANVPPPPMCPANDYQLIMPNYSLQLINAQDAWCISKGSSNVNIAILDYQFDTQLTDLVNKISHTSPNLPNTTTYGHGTRVAGVAACQTDNNNVMSSIGYDCSVSFYPPNCNAILEAANDGAEIINISFLFSCSFIQSCQDIITMLTECGVIIVAAAGNADWGGYCAGGPLLPPGAPNNRNGYVYPASYDHVISVSGVSAKPGTLDKYYAPRFFVPTNTYNPTFNDKVDITAPALWVNTLQLPPVLVHDAGFGTSYATPQVSGTIGLMLTKFPCLPPDEVEHILKTTSNQSVHTNNNPAYIGYTGAGRLDAHQALLMIQNGLVTSEPVQPNITGNTIWTSRKYINSDITIASGGTLTIQEDCFFSETNTIVIERGGKLIVDGARLTSGCEWKGIIVNGLDSAPLNDASQGVVELINGATIENADIGIAVTSVNTSSTIGSGGIVRASNATFRNNREADVKFFPTFNYLHMGSITPSISYFNECIFETTKHPKLNQEVIHVHLERIQGVKFRGCTFRDSSPEEVYPTISNRIRTGIHSVLASYDVESYVSGGTSTPCKFEGLHYGIKGHGFGTVPGLVVSTINIREADFSSRYGFLLTGINNSRIINNSFNTVGKTADPYQHLFPQTVFGAIRFIPYGAYLSNCTGYKFEGNDFDSDFQGTAPTYPTIGLVVNGSRDAPNTIYRNTFTDYAIAIECVGNNRGSSFASGLKLKCNDFINNYNDIYVHTIPDGTLGISQYQGDPINHTTAPAGNLFSKYTGPIGLSTDIVNNGDNITYFHHDPLLPPVNPRVEPNMTSGVTNSKRPIARTNSSCPQINFITATQTDNELANASQSLTSLENSYDLLVDGGNTQAMENEILSVTPASVTTLYNDLMAESPYLSEEIILDLIAQEGDFPDPMLRDVLVANPHAAKSDAVINALNNRTNLLPTYMVVQIEAGINQVDALEYLESQISEAKNQYFTAANHRIRLYYDDHSSSSKASLKTFLGGIAEPTYQYQLVDLELADGNITQAQNILNNLGTICDLDAQQTADHADFQTYYNLLIGIQQNSQSLDNLNSSQIATLQNLMNNADNFTQTYARNLLRIADNSLVNYIEPIYAVQTGNGNKLKGRNEIQSQAVSETAKLKIFPNPAEKYFTVDYAIEADFKNAKIEVLDVNGKVILEQVLTAKQNQVIIQTPDLPNGFYLCKILVDGIIANTEKITINH